MKGVWWPKARKRRPRPWRMLIIPATTPQIFTYRPMKLLKQHHNTHSMSTRSWSLVEVLSRYVGRRMYTLSTYNDEKRRDEMY